MAALIVLVAVLLINTLSYCSAEDVYCVTPTATSCSSCPHNSTHCATLSEYAQTAELYFTSNTTMVFLPGDHVLDKNIRVANISRLTMHGRSSVANTATVVRNGSVGFSFTNMVDFHVYSLAFTSCNKSLSYDSRQASNSALLLQSTQYAKLVNCCFHNNLGTALAVYNTNITLAESNKFTHNQCACQSLNEMQGLGCGIIAFNSNLTFMGNSFFCQNAQAFYCAGAIWASASLLHFNGTNTFIGNSADSLTGIGGAIHAEMNTSLSFSGVSEFSHNSAGYGGAIHAVHSVVLTFLGANNFVNNSAIYNRGGAVYTSYDVVLSFNGTNNFVNNLAINNRGGAMYLSRDVVLTFNGINSFINNSAVNSRGGVIYTVINVELTFNGTNSFINNSATYNRGGAIYTSHNAVLTFNGANNFIGNSALDNRGGAIYSFRNVVLTFTGSNNFISNSANYNGGAVYTTNTIVTFKGINNFIGNSANNDGGGAFVAAGKTSVSFTGTSNFSHNSAGHEGGAVFIADNAILLFSGTINFFNNSANSYGGAIFAIANTSLGITGTSTFISNSAVQGGAISVNVNSTLTFDGDITFTNNGRNSGDSRGGAMHLAITSTVFIFPDTTVCWQNNHAHLGGAIYVFNANPFVYCTMTRFSTFLPRENCFFQLLGQNANDYFVFINNSAEAAGSVLYGGAVDNCQLHGLDSYSLLNSGEVFNMLAQYEDDNKTSTISSDPFHVCLCENNHPNCSRSEKTILVYPGETFQVSVVAVGQRDGIVPAAIATRVDRGRLLHSQYIQQTAKMCTALNYTVFSQLDVTLDLYPEGPCSSISDTLLLHLSVRQSCPPGFNLENSSLSCVCDQTLQKYTNHCNITNGLGQITRDSGDTFWVGYDESLRLLIVHPHCPFDYCVSNTVAFSLNSTLSGKQCAYNRSGYLCGACKEGYSLVLGTSHCRNCTNSYLVLLIPFAVMGVALVFLLFVCKLTVATGTLSGIVFYANIVGVNLTIFLPEESTDALSVFIAWLNLDLGIETCFYNGLDTYSKTWLQFVFPVYIFVLVGFMIFISHYSQRFTNMLGNNPISVLATLILLSYTKVLRTLIIALSFTNLQYEHYYERVWLYDANIKYLSDKHIPLFLVAVLVFFLFLPYILLLVFGQWLQAISHLRLFSWVNRLKPFIDPYHAPYKAKHRYWPGLLLVIRFVLLLLFALNSQQNPSINLLAILVGAGILQLWALVSGGVYKNWCLDALEGSFALNLIMLAAASMYVNITNGNSLAVGYTSVVVALVTFIGILSYHVFMQLRHTKLWKKISKLNLKFRKQKKELHKNLNIKQAEVNLKKLANDATESGEFNQLRELLLDDVSKPTHSVV